MQHIRNAVQQFLKTQPPARIIAIGFALLILLVTLLLMLPISSQSRTVTPPLTALFTATSAVCVTGQVLVDTGMHWSLFGQVVLIAAIQIGGLGVMTLLALLPAVICLLCDWRINGSIVWSGYASGGVALLYVLVALPLGTNTDYRPGGGLQRRRHCSADSAGADRHGRHRRAGRGCARVSVCADARLGEGALVQRVPRDIRVLQRGL